MLSDFHFLQPYWLLLLPLIILMALGVKRSNLNRAHWSKVCDPELLPFLEQQGETQKQYRVIPFLTLIAVLLLVVAVAQPVWKQMPQPVFKKNDAVVIALDLSASMNATDLKPSRLQRARFKIKDLLARIPDAHVSLIVYAADAFIVTPLTEDADNVLDQLPVMSPEIMPVQGSRPDKALLKADQVLKQAGINKGNIVLISDEVSPGQVAKTAAQLRAAGRQVFILAVGTEQGAPIPQNGELITDRQGNVVVAKTQLSDMQEAASIGGGYAVMISPDDRDVSYLVNRFQTNDQAPAETTQQLNLWVAEGPWLVLLALPLLLPLFRRGILNLLLPAVFVISSSLSQDLYAEAETAVGSSAGKAAQFWQNLWQTQDQQAQQIYQTGDARGAAERFKDPRWKQVSHYQSGAYEDALSALESPETSADWYNRGNTLARMGKLEEAIKAYDEALKQHPEHEDASYNRKLLEELQQNQQQQSGQSDQQSEQQDGSDSEQSSQQQKGDASQQNDQQGNSEQQSQGESGEQSSSQNDQQSDPAQQQSKSNQNSDAGTEDGQDKNNQPDSEQNSTQQMKQKLKDKIDQQLSEQQSKNAQQSGSPKDQGEKPQQNQSAKVQPSPEPIDEENAAREQLLNRIEDDPAGLWRRKFIYQYRQQADGQAVEDQQW